MFLPVERWYNAVALRHSVRRYDGSQVQDKILDSLEAMISGFDPFCGTRAVLVREPSRKFVRRFVGTLDKTGVVHYVAFVGDMSDPHVQEATGYVGEGVVLETTALGLNTCWIAALLRKNNIADDVGLAEREKILAITPVGYAEDKSELIEQLRLGSNRSHKRKRIDELVEEGADSMREWSRSAVETARLAPSAANRQPWRFSIGPDSLTVSAAPMQYDFGVSSRLDCGIAALHVQLGAMNAGVHGRLEMLDHPAVARFLLQ